MAKALKKILKDNPSIDYLKNKGEKDFARLHKVELTPDAAGNDDAIFKGRSVSPRTNHGVSVDSSPKDSYGAPGPMKAGIIMTREETVDEGAGFKMRASASENPTAKGKDQQDYQEREFQYKGKNSKAAVNWALKKIQKEFPNHRRHSVEMAEGAGIISAKGSGLAKKKVGKDATAKVITGGGQQPGKTDKYVKEANVNEVLATLGTGPYYKKKEEPKKNPRGPAKPFALGNVKRDKTGFSGTFSGMPSDNKFLDRWAARPKNRDPSYLTAPIKSAKNVCGTVRVKEDTESKLEESSVTRKHFRDVANTVRAIENPTERQKFADHHADIFARQNPRFDHARFHAAAGTQYSKGPRKVTKEETNIDEAKNIGLSYASSDAIKGVSGRGGSGTDYDPKLKHLSSHPVAKKERADPGSKGMDAIHLSRYDKSNHVQWFGRRGDGKYYPFGKMMTIQKEETNIDEAKKGPYEVGTTVKFKAPGTKFGNAMRGTIIQKRRTKDPSYWVRSGSREFPILHNKINREETNIDEGVLKTLKKVVKGAKKAVKKAVKFEVDNWKRTDG